ncbi:MAG: 30S ribosomal protein S20 [Eubacteriaceae bacterium]|nr:30S ribosomal protein S20 [Eubacteriaceae bacterium]
MANIKSAKKRAVTNLKSQLRNKMIMNNLRTTEKKFNAAVESGEVEKAQAEMKNASKRFDMAASKGIIHKNVADRKKSQFAKKVNSIG